MRAACSYRPGWHCKASITGIFLHSWGENYLCFLIKAARKPIEIPSKFLMKVKFITSNQLSISNAKSTFFNLQHNTLGAKVLG